MFSSDIKLVNLAELEFPYQEEKTTQYLFYKYLVGSFNVPKPCMSTKKWIRGVFSYGYCDFKIMCAKSVTLP